MMVETETTESPHSLVTMTVTAVAMVRCTILVQMRRVLIAVSIFSSISRALSALSSPLSALTLIFDCEAEAKAVSEMAKTAAKKKLGFPVPTRVWLREDKYYGIVKDCFTSPAAEKFFNTSELVSLLDDHRAMKYDYSRWSKNAVDYFGLPGEYMYNAGSIWEEHIHPEDRAKYRQSIDEIFAGKALKHDMEYRARAKDGSYVVTGNLRHFPRKPIVVSPADMIKIIGATHSLHKG